MNRFDMAGFDSKPLYRDTVRLAALYEKIIGGCSRQYRFTFGQRLMDRVLRLPVDFHRAYDETDDTLRLQRIAVFREHFTEVKIHTDVAHELKLFSQKDFGFLLDLLGTVERQLEGWYRNTDTRVSAAKGDG